MSLRKKVAELAQAKPELRPVLLPLLRRAQKPTKVIFVSAVLDQPRELVQWWQRQGLPSLEGWDLKAHHMTLAYFGSKGNAQDLEPYRHLIGKPVTLKIVGYALDNRAAAVQVASPLPSTNRIPHITVAVNNTSPVYSNELLERGPIHPASGSLRATVAFWTGREDSFTLPPELV